MQKLTRQITSEQEAIEAYRARFFLGEWETEEINMIVKLGESFIHEVWQAAYVDGATDAINDIKQYEHESQERFFYTSDGEREELIEQKYNLTEKNRP